MMNRCAFSSGLAAGVAASLISGRAMAANSSPTRANNVVLVHGFFADGSCWSEVIARLQAAALNATSVQNPLTTLPDAVASAQRVVARQDGPTVLVGHSFSGMIVTEAGEHPNRGWTIVRDGRRSAYDFEVKTSRRRDRGVRSSLNFRAF
jgi:pimeloyl-ACP methyl ester carboxylesterase